MIDFDNLNATHRAALVAFSAKSHAIAKQDIESLIEASSPKNRVAALRLAIANERHAFFVRNYGEGTQND